MKEIIKSVLKQKRMKYLLAVVSLLVLTIIMNITFAAFSSRKTSELANIKIGKMNYQMKINSTETTKISALSNSITIAEVSIKSLNKTSSKYELIYEVCEGEVYTKNIPDGLKIEYSSETTSPINGEIGKDETKIIRVALINNTDSNITIKFSINAGYSHNELALLNHITNEYQEGDLIIAIKVDGQPVSSMPPKSEASKYVVTVNCTDGTGVWDKEAWGILVSNINGVARCNVEFKDISVLANLIISLASLSSTTGVYAENMGNGIIDYRYKGDTVNNNYIRFNNELWRIIGVFDNNTHGQPGSLVKISRNSSIGNKSWDSSGTNDWSTSSLKTYLNGDYLNGVGSPSLIDITSRNMIQPVIWKLGGFESNIASLPELYAYERGTTVYNGRPTTWTGEIGLIYLTDFSYAGKWLNNETRWALNHNRHNNYAVGTWPRSYDSSSSCTDNKFFCSYIGGLGDVVRGECPKTCGMAGNFLFRQPSLEEETLGDMSDNGTGTIPTLYLKSNIKITGGEGTSGNPYTLGT